MSLRVSRWIAAAVALAFLAAGGTAEAKGKKPGGAKRRPAAATHKPRGKAIFLPDWAEHPATTYGALGVDDCLAELDRRKVEYVRVARAPGVLVPVRVLGDVGGVVYRTETAPAVRAKNPFDVFDCRLVVALHDFSAILKAHHIDEVLMFSAWRPPSKQWPEGKLGTRHPGALAIDAFRFGKRAGEDGEREWLTVDDDFEGALGAPVCAADALGPGASPAARELRAITCEAAERHVFTSILTPNFDRPHKNHLHLEITPNVKWTLLR